MLTELQKRPYRHTCTTVEIRSFGGAYEARTFGGDLSALHHTEKGAVAALAGKLPEGCAMNITHIRNR